MQTPTHVAALSFDTPAFSPAAAVGSTRSYDELDEAARDALRQAWTDSRRGGLVVLSMCATAGLPLILVLSGVLAASITGIADAGFACWLLSAAQGFALFFGRRSRFASACRGMGLSAHECRALAARFERETTEPTFG